MPVVCKGLEEMITFAVAVLHDYKVFIPSVNLHAKA